MGKTRPVELGRRTGLLGLLVLGCLVLGGWVWVEDLAGAWDRATLDPQLEGCWQLREGGIGVSGFVDQELALFAKENDAYVWTKVDTFLGKVEPLIMGRVKTLRLGEQAFLVVPMDEEEGEDLVTTGTVIPYSLDGDTLRMFKFEDEAIWKAIEQKQVVGGTVDPEHAENVLFLIPMWLTTLDEETEAFLAELAKARRWREAGVYERVEDPEAAIARIGKYPGGKDTPRNTRVNINLSDLAYFAEGRTDMLLRHLCTSPAWRVTVEHDEIVCTRRWPVDREWYDSDDGISGWTVSYRSSGWPNQAAPTWTKAAPVFHIGPDREATAAHEDHWKDFKCVDAEAGEVQLNMERDDQSIRSTLAVGRGELWAWFRERTDQEARVCTRAALQMTEKLLAELRQGEAEAREKGYIAALLPSGAIRRGEPRMWLPETGMGGIYEILAWANPGADGEVYVKVFRVDTGQLLSADQMEDRGPELIGWSDDPAELFPYDSEVTVYEGGFDELYDARFELWFQPMDGSPARKLAETTANISGWER
jgi:hypothetical protein